jgi:hypothetical protein
MHSDQAHRDGAASPFSSGSYLFGGTPISRRQAIGRMSAMATVGVAAWVMPEILIATPAGGATLSVPAPLTGATVLNGSNGTNGVTTTAATSPLGSLAATGLDLQRDAQIGAVLIASGWAMHHWSSRTPTRAHGVTEAYEAGSADDPG